MTERAQVQDEREELAERIGSWTDVPLNILGVVLLGIIVVELSVELSPEWESRLSFLNWFIYIVFSLDFFVRLAIAPDKTRFFRRNWLAAISVVLPAFRVFRVLRVVRVLRGLRLVRVVTATNRGTRALSRMLRGYQFGRVLALTIAVVAVGAAALMYFESGRLGLERYGNALWWSAGFVTTIGSDFQPDTLEGRIVALLLVVWGFGVFGFITGSVASYFVGQDATDSTAVELQSLRQEVVELRRMLAQALDQRGG